MEEDKVVVKKARYTGKVDESNYSELICTMSDGEEKVFHFNFSNPMPKEYVIEGETWEFVRGVGMGMFRMAIREQKKFD